MNKQQALLKFDQEFVERLCKDVFPNEYLPEEFNKLKECALTYCSMAFIQQNFGIGWKEYKTIIEKNKDYTLYEINLINTIILTRTPKELFDVIVDYSMTMDAVEEIRMKYDAIVNPIKESIQKRIEIMSNAKGSYKEAPIKFIN